MTSPKLKVYVSDNTSTYPEFSGTGGTSFRFPSTAKENLQNPDLTEKGFVLDMVGKITERLRPQFPTNIRRRLAAVMYADIADYSRLTQEDEEGTHHLLVRYLGLFSQQILKHHGRIAHYAGDAVLAEFQEATCALSCAVTIQQGIGRLNRDLPTKRCAWFRIGLNLGEVIHDRGDIYGNSVNIAARLEGLALPGGICITDAVRVSVSNQLALEYEPLGEVPVKNISEPLRAYHVTGSGLQAHSSAPDVQHGA